MVKKVEEMITSQEVALYRRRYRKVCFPQPDLPFVIEAKYMGSTRRDMHNLGSFFCAWKFEMVEYRPIASRVVLREGNSNSIDIACRCEERRAPSSISLSIEHGHFIMDLPSLNVNDCSVHILVVVNLLGNSIRVGFPRPQRPTVPQTAIPDFSPRKDTSRVDFFKHFAPTFCPYVLWWQVEYTVRKLLKEDIVEGELLIVFLEPVSIDPY